MAQRVRSWFGFEGTALRAAMRAVIAVLLVVSFLAWVDLKYLQSDFASFRSEQMAQRQREDALDRLLEEQKRESEQLKRELDRERSERGRVEQEFAKLREQQTQQTQPPVVFSLGPGLSDRPSGGSPEGRSVTIPRGREMVKFQLDLLGDEYESYLVIIRDEHDQVMWQGLLPSSMTAGGPAVFVRLPSRLFSEGKYRFTLSGTRNKKDYDLISEFPISVSRK